MDRIKATDHFYIDELVCPEIYNEFKGDSLIFVKKNIIQGIEKIRRYFDKPITVCNWATGGQFKYRVLRPFDCKEGAKYSQHKFGNAIDFSISGINSLEIQEEIIKNWSEFSVFFTTIENATIGWTHLDDRFLLNIGNIKPNIINA